MEATMVYNVPHLAAWDWRVAADLFFGGIGVGAFLFAMLVDWRNQGKYKRICQTAAVSAPVFVVLGLFFLMSEMGHPMRLFLTFAAFMPKSPIWWGGIFQTLFIVGTAYYAYLWFKPEVASRRRMAVGGVLFPIALIVGAYHGFLLSFLRARPLWNTGPALVAAVLALITTGIAAVMFIHLIRMALTGRLSQSEWVKDFLLDMRGVRNILGAALILQVFTLFVWWVSLLFGLEPAQAALNAALAAYGPIFWYGGIGLGLVIPMILGASMVLYSRSASVRLEVNMIWLTSGLILVGGFIFRLAVVLGGQLA